MYKQRKTSILYTTRKVGKICVEAKFLRKDTETKPNSVVKDFQEALKLQELREGICDNGM